MEILSNRVVIAIAVFMILILGGCIQQDVGEGGHAMSTAASEPIDDIPSVIYATPPGHTMDEDKDVEPGGDDVLQFDGDANVDEDASSSGNEGDGANSTETFLYDETILRNFYSRDR